MSSGSSDGATKLNPARSVQGTSDGGQVIIANSGNSNHTTQTDHDFQIPITNIDDFLSKVSLSSDKNTHTKSPYKTLSDEPVSCCSSQHTVSLSEKAGIQVPIQSNPLDYSILDAGNGKSAILPVETTHVNQLKEKSSAVLNGSSPDIPNAGSKYMYQIGNDSDLNSDSADSSVTVNKMPGSGGSLYEPSCSYDAQQPAAGSHSHLSQSPNGSSSFQHASSQNTSLDQTFDVLQVFSDVSLTNKENSVTTTQCSQLSQLLGVFSTEQPCQSSNSIIPVSSIVCHINSAIEPCDKVQACVASSPGSLQIYSSSSPPDTHSVTQGSTANLHADASLTSGLLKHLNTQTTHSPSMESETSGSSTGRLDARVSASMINKEKVLECRTNLNPHTSSLLKKTSGLKLFDNLDCPVWSSNFKFQVETQIRPNTPKLKSLSIKSKNKSEEKPLEKTTRSESPVPSNTNDSLNQSTELPPMATRSSFLKTNNQPDMNSCLALLKVSDRRQVTAEHCPSGGTLQTVQLAKEKDIHFDATAKSQGRSHPHATQRTFIEVRLSSLSGSSSPVMAHNETVNSKNSKPTQRDTDARLVPMLSPAYSTVEKTNGMVTHTVFGSLCSTKETNSTTNNDSKPNAIVETRKIMKSSTSRLYIKTMERQSFSTDTALSADYNPFSVRHKIKSFENLANFDKPVTKSSDIQSYALAYRASFNQRIASYMGLVNSKDCQAQQRSHVENLIPTTPCSHRLGKSPSSMALINLELPHSSCNTAPLTEDNPEAEVQKAPDGLAPKTPQVLRRKHGKVPHGRLRQLRALSMPELAKLCTEDFAREHGTAVDKTQTGIHPTVLTKLTMAENFPPFATLKEVDVNRVRQGDLGSTEETPQGTPETHGQQPGWSIRWVVQLRPAH